MIGGIVFTFACLSVCVSVCLSHQPYYHNSYESWVKCSLLGERQNDATLGDLDLQLRSHYLLEIWKKSILTIFFTISQTLFTVEL